VNGTIAGQSASAACRFGVLALYANDSHYFQMLNNHRCLVGMDVENRACTSLFPLDNGSPGLAAKAQKPLAVRGLWI
jgi:hypothetical protein